MYIEQKEKKIKNGVAEEKKNKTGFAALILGRMRYLNGQRQDLFPAAAVQVHHGTQSQKNGIHWPSRTSHTADVQR